MKRILAATVIGIILVVSVAFAQQPQQQSPSQLALQITGVIGQWAQMLEVQQRQIAELQGQLAAVTKERDELKAKLPPGEHK